MTHWALGVVSSRHGTRFDPARLDDYDLSFLTGGAQRAVLTAVVALEQRGAVRLSNPLAADAVTDVMTKPKEKDRLNRVAVLANDPSITAVTMVTPGDGTVGHHPVEREVYDTIVGTGTLHPARLQTLVSVKELEYGLRQQGAINRGVWPRRLLSVADHRRVARIDHRSRAGPS